VRLANSAVLVHDDQPQATDEVRGTNGDCHVARYGRCMESLELNDVERAVLKAVGELSSEERWTDTEQASVRVIEILKAESMSFTIFTTPPWFGLQDECLHLEGLGLLKIDPGMASYVRPGEPAPTADRLFLCVTDTGRDVMLDSTSESQ